MPYITKTGEVLICEQCGHTFDKEDKSTTYDGEVYCYECITDYFLDNSCRCDLEELTPDELGIGVTWVDTIVEETHLKL